MKLPERIVAAAILTGLGSPAVSAQGLADYPFIDWSPEVLDAEAPDTGRIDSLIAADANYGYRLISGRIHLRASGDVEQTWRRVVDYANAAGIDVQGNASVFVNSFTDRLQIVEASVTTPEGQVIEADPDTVQVLLEDDGGVFSDDHEVVIPWPSLKPGGVSAFSYRLLTSREQLAAPWSQIVLPGTLAPTQRFELLLSWDEGARRPVLDTDLEALRCSETANSIRCEADDIAAAELDTAVNYIDVLPHVVVAESTSWSDLSRLLGSYVDRSWTDEDEVAAVVADVIAGADTDAERLEALHSFVAGEIRYVGIETGVNGVIPRDTGLTLRRRYGDCKDKTALFLQMAEIAGLSATPFVVSSFRKNPDKLLAPSLAYFDHMIACVELADGSTCIDLTDPYTPTGPFPGYLQDAPALALREQGSDSPERFRGEPYAWRLAVTTRSELDGATIRETERRTYGPLYSGALRGSLAGLGRAEVLRWAAGRYEEIYGIDPGDDFDVGGLDEQQGPVTIESRTQFENSIVVDQFLSYEHALGWLGDLASQFRIDNEHYDYDFDGFEYRGTATFAIDRWRLMAGGAQLDFESRFGSMRRHYEYADGLLTVETVVELPGRVVGLDEFEGFNRFLDTILENATIRFRAEPGRQPLDR